MLSSVSVANMGVGLGGGSLGSFESFQLVPSGAIWGSFMQKETTIKEEKLYMHRHFVIYHPLILGSYVISFYL